ncbi:MAG: hypothetical protein IK099_07745, partial [Clostridia bacterium]|nr:hypothetical protein [Clostridia bacterium]
MRAISCRSGSGDDDDSERKGYESSNSKNEPLYRCILSYTIREQRLNQFIDYMTRALQGRRLWFQVYEIPRNYVYIYEYDQSNLIYQMQGS